MPIDPALDAHFITGGQSNRDVASMLSECRYHWCNEAGGPLDAPIAMPAGSCNSTDCRRGPWHLNDGMGRYVPSVTHAPREA